MKMNNQSYLLLVFAAVGGLACSPEAAGLAETQEGNGPQVIWDLEARPLPEIPFPNNAAARVDPESPTGLRLNLSVVAPTMLETEVRERADQLDGFGTFAPITISFDQPLYLEGLSSRHMDNRQFEDDAVYLVDVTPSSPTYGQPVMLDMGRGFFPLSLKITDAYFDNDPRGMGTNLLFETESELGVDSDFDGVNDQPNVSLSGGSAWDDLLLHYERETHTLMLRPVVPLRERTTYAVVITRRLLGDKGTGAPCSADGDCGDDGSCDMDREQCREPARSPFDWVNHSRQTAELKPLQSVLQPDTVGVAMEDVVFAWSFTTQSVTSTMVTIRNGLYGHGPMAYLAEQFPPTYTLTPAKTAAGLASTGSLYTIKVEELLDKVGDLLAMIAPMIPSMQDSMEPLLASYEHVAYIVAGTYESPDFLTDRDGHATKGHPADDDEAFEVNPETGEAVYGSTTVPFICAIPKADPDYSDPDFPGHNGKPPFPVALFMHGTGSSKMQALAFAGHFAARGMATCGIDAFAHGMPFPAEPMPGAMLTISEEGIIDLIEMVAPEYVPIYQILKGTRARDLNMDGNLDPAGDFWTMDPFHTRDAIRQTVVDLIQFTRILRSMDGKNLGLTDAGGEVGPDLLGDFDGDGQVELGGWNNRYFSYGISLGGIVTAVFAGVEPALDAATVIVGGGGLTDVAVRSTNPGVPEMAIMPMMGPIYLGDRYDDWSGCEVQELCDPCWRGEAGCDPCDAPDDLLMRYLMPVFDHVEALPMLCLHGVKDGWTVRMENLNTGADEHAVVGAAIGFRIHLQGDALRATELRAYTGFDSLARVGGETCKSDNDCNGLLCAGGECECDEDAHCPAGWRCAKFHKCMMVTQPVKTVDVPGRPDLGDRMTVAVLDELGQVVQTVDRFHYNVHANGVIYPEGEPLVNLYRGFGYKRQTPGFRRFFSIAQAILEPGDPVNWARHYALEPLQYPTDPDAKPGTNVLLLLGVGDSNVPIATGLNIARAAGILGFAEPDGRFGDRTQMEVLVDKHVVEGLFNRCRYTVDISTADGARQECVLFDADDLDNARHTANCTCQDDDSQASVAGWLCGDGEGTPCGDGFGLPFDLPEPLRATSAVRAAYTPDLQQAPTCARKNADGTCAVFKDDAGVQALRLITTRPEGFHGIYLMAPYKAFDIETYQLNAILRFFISSGTEIWDDVCLEDNSCSWSFK